MDALQSGLIVAGCALLSAFAVGISIRVAQRYDIRDHPDGGRKVQAQPIPKLGGVAVATVFSACSAVLLLFAQLPETTAKAVGVLIPALLASLVGYVDDVRYLRPNVRLILQAVIGLLAWVMGTRILIADIPVVDLLLTILWFMVVVNGINLLDNTDGLAGAAVLISALGAGAIAAILGQQLVYVLGISLVGVCIGFLLHNWHPARVYMGDSGAYFLGFLLATLIVRLAPTSLPPALGAVIALLLVALPLVDTTYVVVKRLRTGVHPFTAGRDHLAHVLQDRGHTVENSVLPLLGLAGIATVLAVVIAALGTS